MNIQVSSISNMYQVEGAPRHASCMDDGSDRFIPAPARPFAHNTSLEYVNMEAPAQQGESKLAAAGPTPGRSTMVREGEEHSFTHYYGMLVHQQNMLQDESRTGTYREAVLDNTRDFRDKVIVDVGTGSGILAIFAAQAGARKVYAIEASAAMAAKATQIVLSNGLDNIITVVQGKIEEVEIPEKVDLIISEPMGFMLLHERMLEVFVLAREKWGKPDCKMFPTTGTVYVAPFCDRELYSQRDQGASFWKQNVYGVSLRGLADTAEEQCFAQPVVGYFSPEILLIPLHQASKKVIDFSKTSSKALESCDIPFEFCIQKTELMHGIASWFDVKFFGSDAMVCLSTSPQVPGTHWYQCRLLFREPIAVNHGQVVAGVVRMRANTYSSFEVEVECQVKGTTVSAQATIHLHDQHYAYLQSE